MDILTDKKNNQVGYALDAIQLKYGKWILWRPGLTQYNLMSPKLYSKLELYSTRDFHNL